MMHIDATKHLTDEEIKRLRSHWRTHAQACAVTGHRLPVVTHMLVELALGTGLRVSEIRRIKCGDLSIRSGTDAAIEITRSKRIRNARDRIFIPDGLAKHLREFIMWKRTIGEAIGPEDPLLVSKRGPYSISGLQRLWIRAGEEAEVRPLSIHKARHTAAVQLLEQTGDIRLVQQVLGHTSITTTQIYASAKPKAIRAAQNACYDQAS
jgi:integrase